MMKYFTRTPAPAEECYYEEYMYEMKDHTGVSNQTPKFPTWIIDAKVNEIKVKTMELTIDKVNTSEMGDIIAKKTQTRPIMPKETIRFDLMFLPKIGTLVLEKVDVICHKLKIWYKR